MQKASRTPPVVAVGKAETNIVQLPRGSAATHQQETSPSEVEELSALMERASSAARQMKYFSLAAKRFSLEELASSAGRAGFVLTGVNTRSLEASFQWASGQPDLVFSLSFRDPARVSIVAESQADVFGLVLTAYSHVVSISVEINPTVQDNDLGHNALLFKDMLLTFPGFDDVPAWAKHPEGHIPEADGLVAMWRDGVSLASIFSRTWSSILPRVLAVWDLLREHWFRPR